MASFASPGSSSSRSSSLLSYPERPWAYFRRPVGEGTYSDSGSPFIEAKRSFTNFFTAVAERFEVDAIALRLFLAR